MVNFNIGTSGFIGSKKQWLTIPYINCLEINTTFYRLPTKKTINNFKDLIDKRNGELIFSVKVSRLITHMKRLHNCKSEFVKFWNSV